MNQEQRELAEGKAAALSIRVYGVCGKAGLPDVLVKLMAAELHELFAAAGLDVLRIAALMQRVRLAPYYLLSQELDRIAGKLVPEDN